MIRLRNWMIGIALCAAFPSLGQQSANPPAGTPPSIPPSAAASPTPANIAADVKALMPDYQIGPEDVLEISVWKEEGLNRFLLPETCRLPVRQHGRFSRKSRSG